MPRRTARPTREKGERDPHAAPARSGAGLAAGRGGADCACRTRGCVRARDPRPIDATRGLGARASTGQGRPALQRARRDGVRLRSGLRLERGPRRLGAHVTAGLERGRRGRGLPPARRHLHGCLAGRLGGYPSGARRVRVLGGEGAVRSGGDRGEGAGERGDAAVGGRGVLDRPLRRPCARAPARGRGSRLRGRARRRRTAGAATAGARPRGRGGRARPRIAGRDRAPGSRRRRVRRSPRRPLGRRLRRAGHALRAGMAGPGVAGRPRGGRLARRLAAAVRAVGGVGRAALARPCADAERCRPRGRVGRARARRRPGPPHRRGGLGGRVGRRRRRVGGDSERGAWAARSARRAPLLDCCPGLGRGAARGRTRERVPRGACLGRAVGDDLRAAPAREGVRPRCARRVRCVPPPAGGSPDPARRARSRR